MNSAGLKSKWEQARKGKSGVGDQDVSGAGQVVSDWSRIKHYFLLQPLHELTR